LVCGGAGFIGSHISEAFCAAGWQTTVLDSLVAGTGGQRANLDQLGPQVRVVWARVEAVAGLCEMVANVDVVLDCMGWTHHREAATDPVRDLQLNLASHLHLLKAMPHTDQPRLIYLGSSHEYGASAKRTIDEDSPLVPLDVQSVHKAAADHHVRIAAQSAGFSAFSLRFGNTFGPRQPVDGEDIGLIGGLIRAALETGTVTVFSGRRRRTCVYVRDLAEVVVRAPARG